MKTSVLFYKRYKETVLAEDYIHWSHTLIERNFSSPSLYIISSLSPNDNIFEVEGYFNQALYELAIPIPSLEESARAYISFLSNSILHNETGVFDQAYEIYRIVAELDYPEDLMEWYLISEMIDQLRYDNAPLLFNEQDVLAKIKREAGLLVCWQQTEEGSR